MDGEDIAEIDCNNSWHAITINSRYTVHSSVAVQYRYVYMLYIRRLLRCISIFSIFAIPPRLAAFFIMITRYKNRRGRVKEALLTTTFFFSRELGIFPRSRKVYFTIIGDAQKAPRPYVGCYDWWLCMVINSFGT